MAEATISKIQAREILDSRGNPTVSVKVALSDGSVGVAAVPSGASTGTHEALELRDGNESRYNGKGVLKAVSNVNERIQQALQGKSPFKQREVDKIMLELDGTENKRNLGANAILGVSLATCRAAAASAGKPLYAWIRHTFELDHKFKRFQLPIATMNLLNGGAHAGFTIDFQETMIVPLQKKMAERVRCGSEVFHALGDILVRLGYTTGVGDEGGYAPRLGSNERAIKLMIEAIKDAGYEPGEEVCLGADVAANEFYDAENEVYELKSEQRTLTADQLNELYGQWLKKYPIVTLEDGLAEDDWDNWVKHTEALGETIDLVGDDLFVTNADRLKKGIEMGVANAILIKVNQIGSLSETIDTILLAKKNDYKTSISHRSGETADTFIADLAVAVNSEYIKTGSLSRSERLEKYNRLMEIEMELS